MKPRHAALFVVVLLPGCPEHGSGGGGGGDDAPVSPFETARISPQLCSGGMPGDPTCPINTVPLPMPPNTNLRFVAMGLGSSTFMSSIEIVPGPEGVFLVHPRVVVWTGDTDSPDPSDHFAGVTMNLPPAQIGVLDSFALVGFEPVNRLSFRFDQLSSFAPPPPDDL